MNSDIFEKIEKQEDNILNELESIENRILDNIKITTGISAEFKELLISRLINILSTVNTVNTWERE